MFGLAIILLTHIIDTRDETISSLQGYIYKIKHLRKLSDFECKQKDIIDEAKIKIERIESEDIEINATTGTHTISI
jgi:hypothetical protein